MFPFGSSPKWSSRASVRWLRVLFVLGAALLLVPSIGSRAQWGYYYPPHVHAFDPATDPPIDTPYPSVHYPGGEPLAGSGVYRNPVR